MPPSSKRRHEEAHGRTAVLERKLYQEKPLVLDVPDPSNFRVLFKIKMDGLEPELGESQHKCILMGIVPARVATENFAVEDDHPKHGFYITDYGNLWGQDGTDTDSDIHNLPIGTTLSLHFLREPFPVLLASADDQQPVVLNFDRPIPPDDYRPCVVFRTEGTSVEATVVETSCSKKRAPAAAATALSSTVLTKMWESRSYTDAELVCEGRTFPVHREVLATVSPVFAAAFGGRMKEAATARLEVGDSTAAAVEAFVRCAYTERLEAHDAAAVLPLAHRYQVERMVKQCGEELLGHLCTESVPKTACALRRLREDKLVSVFWDRLVSRLLSDEGLLRAALEHMS